MSLTISEELVYNEIEHVEKASNQALGDALFLLKLSQKEEKRDA